MDYGGAYISENANRRQGRQGRILGRKRFAPPQWGGILRI